MALFLDRLLIRDCRNLLIISNLRLDLARPRVLAFNSLLRNAKPIPFMYRILQYQKPQLPVFSPFSRLSSLRDQLENLFDLPAQEGWAPALDVFQNDEKVVVKTELPGLKKEDIAISLHEGVLTLSGERKSDETSGGQFFRSERYFGRFERTVTLPVVVDGTKVNATYQDGVLTVTLPKSEEAKPKHIEVTVS